MKSLHAILQVTLLVTGLVLAGPAEAGRDSITGTARMSSPIQFTPPASPLLAAPCDGNNNLHDLYLDGALMSGPLVGIAWTPAANATISSVEVFAGEVVGLNQLAIWSDDGGAPSAPLAALGATDPFAVDLPNTWYGGDLLTPVAVTAGGSYWIVWDPEPGQQCSCTDLPTDIQQIYWGSFTGNVNGGATWFGPSSAPDHRWKFRVSCGGCPDGDADGICDDVDLCPGTVTPDTVVRLGMNRFALVDGDDVFDTTRSRGLGPQVTFTLQSTGGCSCAQIADALHVGEGHDKYGCSLGIMRRWADIAAP